MDNQKTSDGDDLGALLSVVTSGADFRSSAAGLAILFDESLEKPLETLNRLLLEGLLFSTSHRLQAVALVAQLAYERSKPLLHDLAGRETEGDAVRSLATVLLFGTPAAKMEALALNPQQYMNNKSNDSACNASQAQSWETLGIAEVPSEEEWLREAASGPMLPRQQSAIISLLHSSDERKLLDKGKCKASISGIAKHNPAVASELLTGVFDASERSRAIDEFTAIDINIITCVSGVLDRNSIVDSGTLARFVSRTIDLAIQKASSRIARLVGYFLDKVLNLQIGAVLMALDEVEAFCIQVGRDWVETR